MLVRCRTEQREERLSSYLLSWEGKAEEGYTGRSPVGCDEQARREEMLVQQGNGAGGWRVREGPLMHRCLCRNLSAARS